LFVDIMHNRGTDLACEAYVNQQFHLVDECGCFGWNRDYEPPKPGECSVSSTVNRVTDYPLCGDIVRPKDWDKLLAMAKKMSRIIGIFVRIDMYIHQGEVVIGEATFLPV
jgi:hypothetical protein